MVAPTVQTREPRHSIATESIIQGLTPGHRAPAPSVMPGEAPKGGSDAHPGEHLSLPKAGAAARARAHKAVCAHHTLADSYPAQAEPEWRHEHGLEHITHGHHAHIPGGLPGEPHEPAVQTRGHRYSLATESIIHNLTPGHHAPVPAVMPGEAPEEKTPGKKKAGSNADSETTEKSEPKASPLKDAIANLEAACASAEDSIGKTEHRV